MKTPKEKLPEERGRGGMGEGKRKREIRQSGFQKFPARDGPARRAEKAQFPHACEASSHFWSVTKARDFLLRSILIPLLSCLKCISETQPENLRWLGANRKGEGKKLHAICLSWFGKSSPRGETPRGTNGRWWEAEGRPVDPGARQTVRKRPMRGLPGEMPASPAAAPEQCAPARSPLVISSPRKGRLGPWPESRAAGQEAGGGTWLPCCRTRTLRERKGRPLKTLRRQLAPRPSRRARRNRPGQWPWSSARTNTGAEDQKRQTGKQGEGGVRDGRGSKRFGKRSSRTGPLGAFESSAGWERIIIIKNLQGKGETEAQRG